MIIPVFDGQAYLAETLASVAAQTLAELEIIVVDDGSADDTPRIAQGFADARLRYHRQHRAGASAARNLGVEAAQGRYLAFLDADDLWAPQKLSVQVQHLERGATDMSFTLMDEFVSPDCVEALGASVQPRRGVPGGINTLMMARTDFLRVGLLDTACELGEIIEWRARAADLGMTALTVPECLTRRRLHLTNMTRVRRGEARLYARTMKRVLDRRRAAP